MMRSCARRSFDAATIFIALVICCVFLTARIRRRRSISDGMSSALALGRRRFPRTEIGGEFPDRLVERAFQLVIELFLLLNAGEDFGVARLDELVQLGLEGPHFRNGDVV